MNKYGIRKLLTIQLNLNLCVLVELLERFVKKYASYTCKQIKLQLILASESCHVLSTHE